MAQGALQKKSLILDQPLSRIILDPEAKAWDPDPATLHELVKDLENVAMDITHTAKQNLQLTPCTQNMQMSSIRLWQTMAHPITA